MFTDGDAFTVAPEVELSPEAGDQLNTPFPPDAARSIDCPLQMAGEEGVTSRIFTPVLAAIV